MIEGWINALLAIRIPDSWVQFLLRAGLLVGAILLAYHTGRKIWEFFKEG